LTDTFKADQLRLTGHAIHGVLPDALQYTAPELLQNGRLDPPTMAGDLWSVGAVAFEVLTTHAPFPASCSPACVRRHAQQQQPMAWEFDERASVDELSRRYARLRGLLSDVLRCLRRQPAERGAARVPVPSDDGPRFPVHLPAGDTSLASWLRQRYYFNVD
jgi:serine/threonine protein kinase